MSYILYKYLQPDRIDVLENANLRLTQPTELNDDHEALPNLASMVSEELLQSVLSNQQLLLDHEDEAIKMFDNAPVYSEYDESKRRKLYRLSLPFLKDWLPEVSRILNTEMFQSIIPVFANLILSIVDKVLGVISLTDNPLSDTMWARYGQNNSGFVVGLDVSNPLFSQRAGQPEWIGPALAVDYFTEKPNLTIVDLASRQFLFSKGIGWSSESEWRIVLPLSEASRHETLESVYLLSIPRTTIRHVILGSRANAMLEARIRTVLDAHPEYRATLLYRVGVSANTYTLNGDLQSRFREHDLVKMRSDGYGECNESIEAIGLALTQSGVPSLGALKFVVDTYTPIASALLKDDSETKLRTALQGLDLPHDLFSDRVHLCLILYSGRTWVDLCHGLRQPKHTPANSAVARDIQKKNNLIDLAGLNAAYEDELGAEEMARLRLIYGEPNIPLDPSPEEATDGEVVDDVSGVLGRALLCVAEQARDPEVFSPLPRALLACPCCGGLLEFRFHGGSSIRFEQSIGFRCMERDHILSLQDVNMWDEHMKNVLSILTYNTLFIDLEIPTNRALTEAELDKLRPFLEGEETDDTKSPFTSA